MQELCGICRWPVTTAQRSLPPSPPHLPTPDKTLLSSTSPCGGIDPMGCHDWVWLVLTNPLPAGPAINSQFPGLVSRLPWQTVIHQLPRCCDKATPWCPLPQVLTPEEGNQGSSKTGPQCFRPLAFTFKSRVWMSGQWPGGSWDPRRRGNGVKGSHALEFPW